MLRQSEENVSREGRIVLTGERVGSKSGSEERRRKRGGSVLGRDEDELAVSVGSALGVAVSVERLEGEGPSSPG
jgi:hypothetical protein